MYTIDINLLKERPGYNQAAAAATGPFGLPLDLADRNPLLLGAAFAGGMVGLVLALVLVLTLFNQRLSAREQELDGELAAIAPALSNVEGLQVQTQQLKAETLALATIFNQVKPWAAMLQDLRDRTPAGLQITRVEQAAAAPTPAAPAAAASPAASPAPSPAASPGPAPSPGAAPAPAPATANLTISGNALSFGTINDFVLALQRSPFLKGEATQLVEAQLQEGEQTTVPLAEFRLQSGITDVPASELLQELSRKGATGLVTRIQILKEQGALQP